MNTSTSRGRTTSKWVGTVLATMLLAVSFVAADAVVSPQPAQAAPSGSDFNPGFIISDEIFFDRTTMSVKDIQTFLDEKGELCFFNCLKDYRGDIYEQPANTNRCRSPLEGKTDVSAAQIIYDISRACHINPQVILVKMQKEMSLITMNNPQDWRYQKAMGYACPDSRPGCDSKFASFYAQLYYGAGQLNWYSNPASIFHWYPIGEVSNVLYHPTASRGCGSSPVLIQNRATAALYYYTPYQPNKAALDNMYGLGDNCSSYGNRNFWRMFHDWFGDPVGNCSLGLNQRFCDVPTTSAWVTEVHWLAESGITTGYPDQTFRPAGNLTRQAMAAFLYRMADIDGFTAPSSPTFPDVPRSHAFYREIEWLASTGIGRGYDDGTFRPQANISRQAMAAFLYRLANDDAAVTVALSVPLATRSDVEVSPSPEPVLTPSPSPSPTPDVEATDSPEVTTGELKPNSGSTLTTTPSPSTSPSPSPSPSPERKPSYTDVSTNSPFFTEIEWLSEVGITTGYEDGTFRPSDSITRRAMAAFLFRFSELDQ